MSQYKKGQKVITSGLVIFVIATLATFTMIMVMSSGIGGIADQSIGLLTQN